MHEGSPRAFVVKQNEANNKNSAIADKSMSVNGKNCQTIVTAGGLGDMLIVLCKLHSEHIRHNATFKIIRYDLFSQYENLIESLISSAPFAEFVRPSRIVADLNALHLAISKASFPCVGTKWYKTSEETYDFDYNILSPYPRLQTEKQKIDKNKINIGIQLFCGLDGHNFRGFKVKWLGRLRSRLPAEKFNLWLFGDSSKEYDLSEVESICSRLKINNMVNKIPFKEWMGYISAMDRFISLEGFSALYAMSQRLPTLLYNQYPRGIGKSLHPLWLENSTVINLNRNPVLRKLRGIFNYSNLYGPSIPRTFIKEAHRD